MASTSAPSSTPADVECIASTRALGKVHRGGRVALDQITLDLDPGSIAALIGANGSGKTTLLRLLAGRTAATAGSVRVLGRDPVVHRRELAAQVAYVSQDVALDPEMTGAETLALFAALYRVALAPALALATSMGLGEHLASEIATYSGGLRRRLHLAAGMLHAPMLLLLDEPTAGLDPGGADQLWDLLARGAARGQTTLIATHDLARVERSAHRVLFLDQGRLLAAGAPRALVSAHAHAQLLVTLRALPPADPLTRLAHLPGVTRVRHDQHRLAIDADHADRHALIAELAALPLEIADLNWREPDLAQAWESLTGRDATALFATHGTGLA
ncbi:MAG: ABC transporter ATP-binding protein [Planctomycetota bacterium]